MGTESNGSLLEGASLELMGFQTIAAARKSPGIMVVNPRHEIVYVNRNAWDLLGLLREQGTVHGDVLMPKAIVDICQDVRALGQENFEIRSQPNADAVRQIHTPNGSVLLRALMLESGSDISAHARPILVLLEHVVTRTLSPTELKDRFGLTEREWAVTQVLLKGYTNKEIAQSLSISEPTVKSHLNRIMQKLECNTRTAVVSLMMGAS